MIRPATPADLPAIHALWPHQDLAGELSTPGAHLDVLGDPVAAFCNYRLVFDEIQIFAIATHPDHRRRGLGAQLLAHALAAPGATRATLEVRRGNTAAIALYERAGFATIHTRRGYYQDNSEDALVMSRPLP